MRRALRRLRYEWRRATAPGVVIEEAFGSGTFRVGDVLEVVRTGEIVRVDGIERG